MFSVLLSIVAIAAYTVGQGSTPNIVFLPSYANSTIDPFQSTTLRLRGFTYTATVPPVFRNTTKSPLALLVDSGLFGATNATQRETLLARSQSLLWTPVSLTRVNLTLGNLMLTTDPTSPTGEFNQFVRLPTSQIWQNVTVVNSTRYLSWRSLQPADSVIGNASFVLKGVGFAIITEIDVRGQ